jgi:F-type H+-transporting ATPase subunit b
LKKATVYTTALLAVIVCAGVAYASGHEEPEGLNWTDLLYRTINFILVAGLIVKLAGKKITGFFRGRSAQIENQLADLDARKIEAERKLREVESSISNLEAERARIMAEYRAQGEALKAQIVAKANDAAARLREQAKVTIDTETKVAVETLRAELAEMVAAAAEKMITEKLSSAEHEKLVDDYLTKVVLN